MTPPPADRRCVRRTAWESQLIARAVDLYSDQEGWVGLWWPYGELTALPLAHLLADMPVEAWSA